MLMSSGRKRWSPADSGATTFLQDLRGALPPSAADKIADVTIQHHFEGDVITVKFTMPNRSLHLPERMWGTPEGLSLILVVCP